MTDKQLYRETFSRIQASLDVRRNIMSMNTTRPRPRRLLPVLLTAVLLVAALSITVLAAVDSPVRDWFREQWASFAGGELSEDQATLIDSLTQPVGESVTVDGVTVTVDSITVGSDILWALVEVSGMEFSAGKSYTFDDMYVEVIPELSDGSIDGGVYGAMWKFLGMDQNGVLSFLVEYSATFPGEAQLTDGAYSLLITAEDLALDPLGLDNNEVIKEGVWEFAIPLTVESLSPVREIPDAQVTLNGLQVTLTDITVTATGARFHSSRIVDPLTAVFAVLSDGTVVESVGGGGIYDDDVGAVCSVQWPAPLDVEAVTALRVGDTDIPLN